MSRFSASPSLPIVALGGVARGASSTERALAIAAEGARAAGADVTIFDGPFLASLPHYQSAPLACCRPAQEFLSAVRSAEGLIIASPGWHGSVSGLVKNAIDYLEETARDARAYLDGLPVGLLATAHGAQAAAGTLATLRSIVHALRGWPTPYGAAINGASAPFDDGDLCARLRHVGSQVVEFATLRRSAVREVVT